MIQSLKCGVGLIHHRVERVGDDCNHLLREFKLLTMAILLVINTNYYRLRTPIFDDPNTHADHIIGPGLVWISSGVNRDDSHVTLSKQG